MWSVNSELPPPYTHYENFSHSSSLYANPFIEQIEHYPQEKLHVSTDKDSYIAGDTIWLRAHCADAATHRPVAASRYVYVELRDDRGSLVRRIKLLSRDSVYSGYLPTQSLERFGDYSLTAYTLYMRNQGPDYFFKKPLTIWPYQESRRTQRNTSVRKVSDFDVSFFPEGGYLIDGYDCCVAFKALGDDGGSVEITGVVKNDRDEVVDTLRTLHGGMGCLRFTPHTGERYYAECTMEGGKTERFDLPASNNLACVLRVLHTERDFTVMVQSGRPLPKGLRLLVHCRGNLCYFREWNDDLPSLIFKRDKLPGGVLQILLLDKAGNALSERLVFNRGEELATTDMQVRGALKQRAKVTLAVTAGEPGGGPGAGCGARRTAAHARMAALRRAGRGTGRVCDAGLPARSRAGDRGADQQGRTVEQEEEARPLRDADDRAAVALLVAGADRQGGTVRAQRLRLPRQHALRTAARGGEGAAAGGLREGRARFVPRGGDAAPRAGSGCGESLPRPGTALHRAARADRYEKHPHRHGRSDASYPAGDEIARTAAGGAYMGYATNKRNGRI